MTIDTISIAIRSCVGLLGLWLVIFWLFKDYRVDALRQRLFDLRAELFDYAESGAISFQHPAYGTLRSRINLMIRFAHRFSSPQLVLVGIFQRHAPVRGPYEAWLRTVETVNDAEVRDRLKEFNQRMFVILVWHLVTGSPTLMGGLLVSAMCSVIKGAAQRIIEDFALRLPGLIRIELQATEIESNAKLAA